MFWESAKDVNCYTLFVAGHTGLVACLRGGRRCEQGAVGADWDHQK